MSIFDQAVNQLSITREYWDSIPFSRPEQKYAYLASATTRFEAPPHPMKSEDSLLQIYERAMKERNHAVLSDLHLKCFSLKLLPMAARYCDLVTLSTLIKHRNPDKNNYYLKEAVACAHPLSLGFLESLGLTSQIGSQVPT